ncbi:MAG: CRISPR-associated protein Cas5 [Acidobacteriaceae bacterium]|nr:CRISPR-associated protein Cas5 [Acidobacteriaceae bacterium]
MVLRCHSFALGITRTAENLRLFPSPAATIQRSPSSLTVPPPATIVGLAKAARGKNHVW